MMENIDDTMENLMQRKLPSGDSRILLHTASITKIFPVDSFFPQIDFNIPPLGMQATNEDEQKVLL